jgi:NAD(P)-dependent dehydrogenase (short-subunit alcohol dehydrogenase family)
LCKQLKFKNGANIIAIGSVYASFAKENRLQYMMSKHALYGAVKTIALEKSSCSIKVNMISPGFVDTNLTKQNNSAKRIKFLNDNIPLGLVDPLQISNFCLYLLQQNNSITGQNINIDGGYTLKGI